MRASCPLLRSPLHFLLSDLAVFRGSIEVMPFAFEKLIVYQKAVDFADEVAALTESFPRGYGFLVDQLNRAAQANRPCITISRSALL